MRNHDETTFSIQATSGCLVSSVARKASFCQNEGLDADEADCWLTSLPEGETLLFGQGDVAPQAYFTIVDPEIESTFGIGADPGFVHNGSTIPTIIG